MENRYYVAMAYDAGGFGQSDQLYLIKLRDGKIIGYAHEFEVATHDVADACSRDNHALAKWIGWTGEEGGWTPATFEEIKSLGWENTIVGVKRHIALGEPIEPLKDA